MEFNDVLNRRYSCRAFANQTVEQEKVDRILEAGRIASTMHGERKTIEELVTEI